MDKDEELFSEAPSEEPIVESSETPNPPKETKREDRPWLKQAEKPQYDFNNLDCRPVMSVETLGGADEIITVIEKLPKEEDLLSALTWKIGRECRLKAEYRTDRRDGVIEVMGGDKRISLRDFFKNMGITIVG